MLKIRPPFFFDTQKIPGVYWLAPPSGDTGFKNLTLETLAIPGPVRWVGIVICHDISEVAGSNGENWQAGARRSISIRFPNAAEAVTGAIEKGTNERLSILKGKHWILRIPI